MLKCPNCGSQDKFEKLERTIYESSIRDKDSRVLDTKREEDDSIDKVHCLKCHHIGKLDDFYIEDGNFVCPKCGKSDNIIGIAEDAIIRVDFDKFGRKKSWWYGGTVEIIKADYTKCQCWHCGYTGDVEEFKTNKDVSLPLKEDN